MFIVISSFRHFISLSTFTKSIKEGHIGGAFTDAGNPVLPGETAGDGE